MKRIIGIVICVAMIFSLSSCAFFEDILTRSVNIVEKEKVFTFEDISITLTTDFMTMDFISEDYSFIWGDGDVTVMGMEAFVGKEYMENITAEDYAVVFEDELEGTESDDIGDLNGIPTIKYEAESDGELYRYLVCIYETADGFWVVMFGSEEDIYEKQYENICTYAKSVKISE